MKSARTTCRIRLFHSLWLRRRLSFVRSSIHSLWHEVLNVAYFYRHIGLIFYVLYSTLIHMPPFRLHCVRDAPVHGIEPRTVATLALVFRRSNHWARSHQRPGVIHVIFLRIYRYI
jgi:hypothetical protein